MALVLQPHGDAGSGYLGGTPQLVTGDSTRPRSTVWATSMARRTPARTWLSRSRRVAEAAPGLSLRRPFHPLLEVPVGADSLRDCRPNDSREAEIRSHRTQVAKRNSLPTEPAPPLPHPPFAGGRASGCRVKLIAGAGAAGTPTRSSPPGRWTTRCAVWPSCRTRCLGRRELRAAPDRHGCRSKPPPPPLPADRPAADGG